MCTCKDKFILVSTLKDALSQDDIYNSFKIVCEDLSKYSKSQIYIANKQGKRMNYIVGAGEDNFSEVTKIELEEGYYLFLQEANKFSDIQKKLIEYTLNIIIFLME